MDVKWIKLYTALPEHRKIKQIRKLPNGDTIALMWIFLMCLAGETNDGGMVYFTKEIAYTDEMLANQFDIDLATVKLALNVFQQFEMIEIVDNIICLPSWEKYQSVDAMERIREQNRIRKQNQRERQRLLTESEECHVTCHADVTQSHATDIDIDKEKDKDNISNRFVAPSGDEVNAYCREHGYNIDGQRFVDYYTARGWMIGKNKIKDWKACVRTWVRNDKPKTSNTKDISDEVF